MNSFILIGNPEQTSIYLEDFARQKEILKFDVHFFEPSEDSFGIRDIREVQKIAFIKPMQSKEKILVIHRAQLLTTEAQNALLKLLEEPPQHTYIFLTTITDASFLPTILSRCKIITLEKEKKILSEEDKELLETDLQTLGQGSVAQKLALAESRAQDKNQLTDWLTNCILILRYKMLENPTDATFVTLLQQLQKARTILRTTNVAPRMILEHTFLTL